MHHLIFQLLFSLPKLSDFRERCYLVKPPLDRDSPEAELILQQPVRSPFSNVLCACIAEFR